jgi:hypothetical protein
MSVGFDCAQRMLFELVWFADLDHLNTHWLATLQGNPTYGTSTLQQGMTNNACFGACMHVLEQLFAYRHESLQTAGCEGWVPFQAGTPCLCFRFPLAVVFGRFQQPTWP